MAIKGRKRGKDMKKRPTTREGRKAYDPGTFNGLLKKAGLLQARLIWDGKVPRFISYIDEKEIAVKYAEYPLGVLFARQIITIRQHDVGIALDKFRNFSGMRSIGMCGSGQQEFVDRTNMEVFHLNDEDAAIRATARYREGCKAMTAAARLEVLNVACYGELPHWINSKQKNPGLWHLLHGLDTLVECYVKGGKRWVN